MTRLWHNPTVPQTPMGAWLRRQPGLDSIRESLAISDLDYLIEKWNWPGDGLGNREVKTLLFLEVKCYGAEPSPAQCENLFIHHLLLYGNFGAQLTLPRRGKCAIWHFGVAFLSLSGEAPDPGGVCRWGRFARTGTGAIEWTTLPYAMLTDILAFRLRPDTLLPLHFRRHHATKMLESPEQMPLGFSIQKRWRHRS